MSDYRVARMALWAFAGLALLCVLLYLPGLRGTFLFDDHPNIVANPSIHVSSLEITEWQQALWASPSSELQRPLASLSFAVNHYFSGLNPLPMKATNLAIHLLNGLLLFTLLRKVVRLAAARDAPLEGRSDWLAAIVSAAWLLHPINLSPVLLVVQRMESLAQVFVLAGLIFYLDARLRQAASQPGARWRLWLAFPMAMLLGVASKESAALLSLYALLLEVIILRRQTTRGIPKSFYALFLVLPAVVGAAWLVPGVFSEGAYASRAFTLVERLLTEPRVLLDYVTWTVLPLPGFFSFFRDDYVVSTSLLQPWTTLPAFLILIGVTVAAWVLRRRRPLVALGWAWFLAAHALTATVFPLELVFEHRNYFASIGVLLIVFDLLMPEASHVAFSAIRRAAVAVVILMTAFSLGLRAKTWGDPLLLAVTEAAQHPASPRAAYSLGVAYAGLGAYRPESPNTQRALDVLQGAARLPNASALPESALIIVSSRSGLPVEPQWIDSMEKKLSSRPITAQDASAIAAVTLCQRDGFCSLDDARLTRLYLTALDKPYRSPWVLYSYGIHAHNRLGNTDLALELTREAASKGDIQFQINLVEFLISQGRDDDARKELAVLEKRDRRGAAIHDISMLRSRLGVE